MSEAHPTKDPMIVRMGTRQIVIGGKLEEGIYKISFSPSDRPLTTEEAKDFDGPPMLVLEFSDLNSMEVLKSAIDSMIEHKQHNPRWEYVRIDARFSNG